jgi:hypothetical protein
VPDIEHREVLDHDPKPPLRALLPVCVNRRISRNSDRLGLGTFVPASHHRVANCGPRRVTTSAYHTRGL